MVLSGLQEWEREKDTMLQCLELLREGSKSMQYLWKKGVTDLTGRAENDMKMHFTLKSEELIRIQQDLRNILPDKILHLNLTINLNPARTSFHKNIL